MQWDKKDKARDSSFVKIRLRFNEPKSKQTKKFVRFWTSLIFFSYFVDKNSLLCLWSITESHVRMIKETISEYSRKFIKLEQEFSPLDKNLCEQKR